ncbi:MAG: exodeoxyribonuclease VII small subunit [Saprospiraceae bacterium]|nr:exodeoxyribonuclease VII small subunit [Candidatus Vicinibacter affinis]MBP6172094.1 exodeoxyribonuclease VII small subunit [Saprospiraceae bacterium]MBK6571154.1 exodeoxyribonuclease VII small subunit [Candidatus Vicinibacter affinis]MBK6822790.1 exodeoxyribonuclease VII small subunit [Candidatus Vicinibacter affinis]MBK7304890.1 exodeoxyribonuclease VII small subunit [Candidatus Vicinibacter affinis]
MAKQKIKYSEAYQELESILQKLQSEEIQVDDILININRAKELLQFCQEALRKINDEIEN